MGSMKISVDAEVAGKRFDFAFTWDGDDDAIKKLMRFIEARADEAGITPETFTHSALRHLPVTGLIDNTGAQEVQMMAILYTILQFPTQSPDRPGAIYNYAGHEDIRARLHVRDQEVTAEINGRPVSN
jgi:hypothetical protein